MSNLEIRTRDHWPLVVTGEITLTGAAGGVVARENTMIVRCRYGRSDTKPFCDGARAHRLRVPRSGAGMSAPPARRRVCAVHRVPPSARVPRTRPTRLRRRPHGVRPGGGPTKIRGRGGACPPPAAPD
jgi:CDGSH-type Zn-finger protein